MVPEVYDHVVASLYEAARGIGAWRAVLDLIADEFDLWCVQLGALDASCRRLLFHHQGGPAAPLEEPWPGRGEPAAANPGFAQCLSLGVGEWLQRDERPDAVNVGPGPGAAEFPIPRGAPGDVLATKVMENAHGVVLLTAVRRADAPPITQGEIAELDRIKRHLIRALKSGVHFGRSDAEQPAAKRLLDQFGYPMFFLDEHRTVRARNAATDALFGPQGFLEERAGALACRDPECDALLVQTVRALQLAAPASPGVPSRKFAKVRRADGAPIGLYAVAVRAEAVLGVFGSAPLALLIFHDPRQQAAVDSAVIAEMFDLSPAEAKVATMLALGKAPDEIAASGHISVSTVRAQIKSIFAKTGVSRQSELVALLRGMPVVTHLGT